MARYLLDTTFRIDLLRDDPATVAAAAHAAGATVVTRNVRDFSLTPVRVESD